MSHHSPTIFSNWQSWCLKAQLVQFVHVFKCQCTGWLWDQLLPWSFQGQSWTVRHKVIEWGDHNCILRQHSGANVNWVNRSTYHVFVVLSTCHSVTLSLGHNDFSYALLCNCICNSLELLVNSSSWSLLWKVLRGILHNIIYVIWVRSPSLLCYESSLSYLVQRPGLVGFRMWQGVWTVASARALRQPSVAVQVFQR